MPLDNTAKLSDIIIALQTMEGINAKADLASVIGTPAVGTDTMARLVSLIQGSKNELAAKMDDGSTGAEPLQTLVENLVVGKKWASGVYASNASLIISGLGFTPQVILWYGITVSDPYFGLYIKTASYPGNLYVAYAGYSGGDGTKILKEISTIAINGGTYTIPIGINLGTKTASWTWIAYE